MSETHDERDGHGQLPGLQRDRPLLPGDHRGQRLGRLWYVSQDGAPETQIPWFPSPSSK
jgi:hypothetical protein